MKVCMYVCMYESVYVRMHVGVGVRALLLQRHMHESTNKHTGFVLYTCVCVCVCVLAHTHTHCEVLSRSEAVDTYIHTLIHIFSLFLL
jgi:hypothetical protein